MTPLRAPMPYFGGKSSVVDLVWSRLGQPKQYIEPFCGSAAMLLGSPRVAELEVISDLNGFIANFWRTVKHQPDEAARWADYPVSHADLGARHVWLMSRRDYLSAALQDPDWPGDAKIAGWWLWGQCAWIGSGWCEWDGKPPSSSASGSGVHADGKIPHASDGGRGIQAIGKIPHASDGGRGIQARSDRSRLSRPLVWGSKAAARGGLDTSSGVVALNWLRRLAQRLERVRIFHGHWARCLNHHYGAEDTAVFFDPPYLAYESLYGSETSSTAREVETWAREHPELRIALCGHIDDYTLEGWDVVRWKRPRLTYAGSSTTDREAIWFSPACEEPKEQLGLFAANDR